MSFKDAVVKATTVSLVSTFTGIAAVMGTVEGIAYATTGESAVMGEAVPAFLNPLVLGAMAGAGLTGYLMGRWGGGGKAAAAAPAKKPEQPAP